MSKPQPRAMPWLVELYANGKWWLLDQYGTREKARDRAQNILDYGRALREDVRIRYDLTPETSERPEPKEWR